MPQNVAFFIGAYNIRSLHFCYRKYEWINLKEKQKERI